MEERRFLNSLFTSINDNDGVVRPLAIFNNNQSNLKDVLLKELLKCDEFKFSVSFIKVSGLYFLRDVLEQLNNNNIPGKILTTDYMNVTEPNALKMLNDFENIEIKVYPSSISGFHAKSYIFRKNNVQTIIIGSSNITRPALISNKEWNLKIQLFEDNELCCSINDEFNDLWSKAKPVDEIIEEYENRFSKVKDTVFQFENIENITFDDNIEPNKMQIEFINKLEYLINNEERKGLLVSATGTGKTYAAGLAFKKLLNENEKVLFIVHSGVILKQAMDSFKKIFEDNLKMECLITNEGIPQEYDFLFSTRQTLTQENGEKRYDNFEKDEFDYIIIDEAHQSASDTYLEILNYFEPKFFLGMTATPDRSDDRNVYELYDYNIVQDIRLNQALEENLLCPFHYFGIGEISLNGETIDFDDFNDIEDNRKADILLEMSKKYPNSGDRLKALVFCRNIEEGRILADLFSEKGHPSVFLDGNATDEERLNSIESLKSDVEGSLEYIFTVKIFNEGVDIPQVNQVLMIRPTQSSIMFIQQLGRGLRKHESKDCVVILDFIGNYDKNYLIPYALTGDISYNRELSFDPEKLPENVTVSLDEVSCRKIFESVDRANRSGEIGVKLFRRKFLQLFDKLGRIPYLFDFYKEQELDSFKILSHSKYNIYYDFLKESFEYFDNNLRDVNYSEKFRQTEDYIFIQNGGFNDIQVKYLKFISKLISNGYRPQELLFLKELCINHEVTIEKIQDLIKELIFDRIIGNPNLDSDNINDYCDIWDENAIEHAISILNRSYFLKNDGLLNNHFIEFEEVNFCDSIEETYVILDHFKEMLENEMFKKHLIDVLDFGLLRFQGEYLDNLLKNHSYLKIYQFYSRDDVIRLLNWPRYVEPIGIGGYSIKNKDCIIFADISDHSDYLNSFIDTKTFSWSSRNDIYLDDGMRPDDEDLVKIRDYKEEDVNLHLFVKNGGSSKYCYLGLIDHDKDHEADTNGEKSVVRFKFNLRIEMNKSIQNYFGID